MNDLTVLIDAGAAGAADGGGVGIDVHQIDVEWDPRAVIIPPAAREYLEMRWQAHLADAKARGGMLFDGGITRLISARKEKGRVILQLGPADYKTFVVTRLRDRPWFEVHAPEVNVGALGNSALLTHGGRAIFGVRSAQVSAYANRAHVLGGVLELLGNGRFSVDVAGMLAHLREELHEEAGLTDGELAGDGWPRLLGVVRDEFLGQPEAMWQWEVNVPLDVLARRLEADEHAGSIIVDRDGVPEAAWRQMTPCARYAWKTWSGRAGGK